MIYTKEAISKFQEKLSKNRKQFKELECEAKEINSYLWDFIKNRVKHLPVRVYEPCALHGYNMITLVVPSWEYNFQFHYLGNGKFSWSTVTHPKYFSQLDLAKEHPFNTQELLKICEELTKELGVNVSVPVTELKYQCDSTPQDSEDVKMLHPNGTILDEDEIVYVGWDCKDNWVIVEDFDGKHLYYGTTAHGGGMNVHLKPGDNLDSFFQLNRDDTIIHRIDTASQLLNY